MPILKNAKKALRVSKRKTIVNSRVRSRVKTLGDAFRKHPTVETLASAYSALDTAVKKNLLKKNKAARVKSQLSKLVPAGTLGTTSAKKVSKPAVKKPAAKKAAPSAKK